MNDAERPALPIAIVGSQILNLVKLNVLWLVCCLPIVTIGPATSAMNHVVNLYLEEKNDQVLRPFFKAFRRDLKQGLALGLLMLILTGIAVFDGLFLLANFSGAAHPAWIPFLILVLFLVSLYVYAFPLLSRYQLRFTELLKNAVALFWQHLVPSILALAVLLLPALLAWIFPGAWSEILFFWILIGGSLTTYINNKSILNILDQEQRKLDEQAIPAAEEPRA